MERAKQIRKEMRETIFPCPSPMSCNSECQFHSVREGKVCCLQDRAIIWGTMGALWADENPKSRHNLSKPDSVAVKLESIINIARHLTTGNLAYHQKEIELLAKVTLDQLKNE